MKNNYILLLLFILPFSVKSQLYFPPTTGNTWETTDPATLGWCQDSINQLYDYLETTNSKAFLILKDGKIVLEKYFGTFTADSFWVWNSAGKTLTGLVVGIAQQEGYLNIDDTTSDHIGQGWTSLSPSLEEKITIRHQLTMTTGLDDNAGDDNCTDPSCLQYLTAPETRWAYHNAPYTLLDTVIESATGMTLNNWVTQKIGNPIGMNGFYYPVGYNNIFISQPRSMARFGLLLQAQGSWNGTPVLNDPTYFYDMTHSSQALNPSYGYLTWLNGQSSFQLPGIQYNFSGSALPSAPSDVFAALGKNGQWINISPSSGIMVIRMGQNDGMSLVPIMYCDTVWQYINRLNCSLSIQNESIENLYLAPNPTTNGKVQVINWNSSTRVTLKNSIGQLVETSIEDGIISTERLESGIYFVTVNGEFERKTMKLVVD